MNIAFLNQKGGVGKTTLSIHTAAELTRQGLRTLLIDADPQGSSLAWSDVREESTFPVIGIPKATVHKEIESFRTDFDAIVIDGPPRASDMARSIIMASDLVVIPVLSSPLDVWATAETIDLVREAQVFNLSLECCAVINRRIANTAIGRSVRDAVMELGVPLLDSEMVQGVAFAESVASGITVLERPLSRSAQEIRRFVIELRRLHEQKSQDHTAAS